jgi:hypothetical protein
MAHLQQREIAGAWMEHELAAELASMIGHSSGVVNSPDRRAAIGGIC